MIVQQLMKKGEAAGCTPYESLLLMVPPVNSSQRQSQTRINEHGNIEESIEYVNIDWEYKAFLKDQIVFWDGTDDETRKRCLPGASETRLIFYASCRGLEAWSAACFNLDEFFEQKFAEKDAELYRSDDMHLGIDERKKMYAMTWALMAMTRAIDTLYIKIKDPNSFIADMLHQFKDLHPTSVTIYQD